MECHWRCESRPTTKPFRAWQGKVLALIYYYTKIHCQPPAEIDIAWYFPISLPSAHQVVATKAGD